MRQAALGIPSGSCTFTESSEGRRLDGEATVCEVTFKVCVLTTSNIYLSARFSLARPTPVRTATAPSLLPH